jgi:hypothetical protein
MEENKAVKDVSADDLDKAVEQLMKEIRQEDVPQRILELARALQAALDARGHQ